MIGLMARPLEKYFFGSPEAGEINVISTGGGGKPSSLWMTFCATILAANRCKRTREALKRVDYIFNKTLVLNKSFLYMLTAPMDDSPLSG